MVKRTQAVNLDGDTLESAIAKLRGLSTESQAAIASIIGKLAQVEGVSSHIDCEPPIENIGAWLTKLRSERKSERTVKMYGYLASRFLRRTPRPSRADIREYLAKRIEDTSPASTETERKALASLFSFLHSEGLWRENPLEGVRHIGSRWGEMERRCPTVEDVGKVLAVGFMRAQDSLKMRTVVVLLATTGLRLTECMSLRRDGVDLDARELRVTGKGGRRRVVPLLESTADTLGRYLEERRPDSPFVFPGNTKTGYAEIYNIEKTLKRACLRAGVEPFTPHQLRHLYATEMLRNGAKLEVVGRILGHSSIGITADVYRHVSRGEMHEEHSKYAPMNGGMVLS